jgi:hypothetical protein
LEQDIRKILKAVDAAYWLKPQEKLAIQNGLSLNYMEKFKEEEKEKIAKLLCAIAYAEKSYRLQGRLFARFCEQLAIIFKIDRYICSTISFLSLHIAHGPRFGYQERKFRHVLTDENQSVYYAIRHIVEDIGLHNRPEHILAEYNHSPLATKVAALQRCLNLLVPSSQLREDGILGPKTYVELSRYNLLFSEMTEMEIQNIMDHFSEHYGWRIAPFVPDVKLKKNIASLRHLWSKRGKRWRDIFHIFGFSVDVRAYVTWGMTAYNELHSKSALKEG